MMTAEQLAQFFHESYERLAPWFGYKTREESAKPWANVPEQNRRLMTAVCVEVLTQAAAQLAEKEQEIARLNKLFCDLTPGGSEFAGDPDYCAKYLRDRANTQTDLLKKKFIELRQREAELEQRWIAVEDKLPEKRGQYLVWVRGIGDGGEMVRCSIEAQFDMTSWRMRGGWLSHEVQGWQPLPSPPKVQP